TAMASRIDQPDDCHGRTDVRSPHGLAPAVLYHARSCHAGLHPMGLDTEFAILWRVSRLSLPPCRRRSSGPLSNSFVACRGLLWLLYPGASGCAVRARRTSPLGCSWNP